MFSKSIALIIRVAQLLFSATIMALIGHMLSTSYYNTIPRTAGNAAEVNFSMFTATFTLFSLIFLFPASWKYFSSPNIFRAAAVVDALSFVFYFSNGIALAAALEVHSCDNRKYTNGNRITQTSPNTRVRCREAQASTAFVWVQVVLFAVTTAFSLSMCLDDFKFSLPESYRISRRGRRSDGGTGGNLGDEERPRVDMEEINGGPMVADDEELEKPMPARAAYGHGRRAGSLNGGHWNADKDGSIDGQIGARGSEARRDRVVNVPVGGPEFADDEGYRMR